MVGRIPTMKLRLSVAALALIAATSVQAGDYKPVTESRLQNPEPENWLLTKGNYAGWSYSPLDQITPANAAKLKPVWSAATDVMATPRPSSRSPDGFPRTPHWVWLKSDRLDRPAVKSLKNISVSVRPMLKVNGFDVDDIQVPASSFAALRRLFRQLSHSISASSLAHFA